MRTPISAKYGYNSSISKLLPGMLFILLAMISGSALRAQKLCNPAASLLKLYDADVKYLAMVRMYQVQSPDTAQIDIPSKYADTIWHALAAVSNSIPSDPAVDSIFKQYCIHHYPYGFSVGSSVSVFVNPAEPWTNSWKNLVTVTGYAALDSFINKYKFSVTYYSASMNLAILSSPDFINIKAFARELEKFTGIFKTELDGVIGDGNTITYTKNPDAVFTFSLKWGDCPAGCTSELKWTYKVDVQCKAIQVSRVLQGSDPFPSAVNCGFDPSGIPDVDLNGVMKLFPNPASGYIMVSLNGGNKDFTYALSDVSGRIIATGRGTGVVRLETDHLAPGLYFIKVQDQSNTISCGKIYKQ